jgi:hypothetical protein
MLDILWLYFGICPLKLACEFFFHFYFLTTLHKRGFHLLSPHHQCFYYGFCHHRGVIKVFVVPVGIVDAHKFGVVSNKVHWATALTLIGVDIVEDSSADDGIEYVGIG